MGGRLGSRTNDEATSLKPEIARRGAGREAFLSRAGMALADLCDRYFPDAFVFALAAVLLVILVTPITIYRQREARQIDEAR